MKIFYLTCIRFVYNMALNQTILTLLTLRMHGKFPGEIKVLSDKFNKLSITESTTTKL